MTRTIPTDEQTWMDGILTFRLPSIFKKIGIGSALAIMAFLIGYKFFGANNMLVKDILRTAMLLFMLLATLSKDKLEDEYNLHIRHQSFVISFVAATAYAIVIPFLAVIIDIAVTTITGDGSVSFYEISAFEVIFTILGIQLLSFHTLKLFARAK